MTATITPIVSRSRRDARHTVILRNPGDTCASFDLEAVDDSGHLTLWLSETAISVPPGEERRVEVDVRARRRWFGRHSRSHPFHVVASGDCARAVWFQDPANWRRPAVAAAALVIAVVAYVALAAMIRPPGPVATERSSGGVPTSAASASVCGEPGHVAIAGFAYCPEAPAVPVGAAVTFENHDAAPHTVTFHGVPATQAGHSVPATQAGHSVPATQAGHSVPATQAGDGMDSGSLERGESFTIRFDQPGTYAYYCRLHPSMRAAITVSSA